MGYLTISRKLSERISIGNEIIIIVSNITKDKNGQFKVDIGIDAPRNLDIKRRLTHLEEQNNGPKFSNKS